MEKEIVGYELRYPAHEKLVIRALNLPIKTAYKPFIISGMIGYYIPMIKELGIMDWFDPVYKEEKSLPIINGYEGEIVLNEKVVKYGCIRLPLENLSGILDNKVLSRDRSVFSIKLDSGVEIKMEQIEQIVNYFK